MIMLTSFVRGRHLKGASTRLSLGPYLIRLAERLGVFKRYHKEYFTEGPATRICELWDPQRWMSVRLGPHTPPPSGTDAAIALHMGVPTHRQHLFIPHIRGHNCSVRWGSRHHSQHRLSHLRGCGTRCGVISAFYSHICKYYFLTLLQILPARVLPSRQVGSRKLVVMQVRLEELVEMTCRPEELVVMGSWYQQAADYILVLFSFYLVFIIMVG